MVADLLACESVEAPKTGGAWGEVWGWAVPPPQIFFLDF